MKEHPEELFWSHVDKRGPDECWEWMAFKDRGYGQFKTGGKTVHAHRVAYAIQDGWESGLREIPKGMLVCHRCDNPACCNPKHLFLGTFQDNSDDMVEKGRSAAKYRIGETNPNSKLTLEQARDIKASSEIYRVLAERYRVSIPAIQSIKIGRTWKTA